MLDCYCMHVTSTGSRLVVLVVHISMHFFIFFTLSEIRKLSYTSGALSCRSPVFRSSSRSISIFRNYIFDFNDYTRIHFHNFSQYFS